MKKKLLALLLSICILTGSVSDIVFAASVSENTAEDMPETVSAGEADIAAHTMEMMEMEEAALPQEEASPSESSNEVLEITDTKMTWCSLSVSYSATKELQCHYAPTEHPEKKEQRTFAKGSGTVTIWGLEENTEYRFRFEAGGVTEEEFTATTQSAQSQITYTLTKHSDYNNFVTLSYQIKGLEDTPAKLFLNYSYVDEKGEQQTKQTLVFTESGEPTEDYENISDLSAMEECRITLWLTEWLHPSVRYGEADYTVDTRTDFTDENISVSVEQDQAEKTAATGTFLISVDGRTGEIASKRGARLYCWREGITDSRKSYPLGKCEYNTAKAFRLENLQQGERYQYLLVYNGVAKAGSFAMGESLYQPEVTDDTDALDSILTYQLKTVGGSAPDAADNYSVQLSYAVRGSGSFEEIGEKQTLDPNDDYRVTVKTGASVLLYPETEYVLRWELFQNDASAPCYTSYQEIRTPALRVELTDVKYRLGVMKAWIVVTSRTEELANNLSFKEFVVLHMKDAESPGVVTKKAYALSGKEGWKTDIKVTDWEIGKKYDFSLIGSDTGYVYADFGTITALGDDRDYTCEIIPELRSIQLKVTVVGDPKEFGNDYLRFYYRRSGSKDAWQAIILQFQERAVLNITSNRVESGVTYDYVMGLGRSSTPMEELVSVKTGTFSTIEDDRDFTMTYTVKHNSIELQVTMTGAVTDMLAQTSVEFRYRKTGDEGAEWQTDSLDFKRQGTQICTIRNLEEDTSYDYEIGIDRGVSSIQELIKPRTGTFRTAKQNRRIVVSDDGVSAGYGSATIAGRMVENDLLLGSYIFLFYRRVGDDGENAWERANCYSKADSAEEIEKYYIHEYAAKELGFKWKLKNLAPGGTEYEYVTGIADKVILSPQELLETTKASGTFRTKTNPYTIEITNDAAGLTYKQATVHVAAKLADETAGDSSIQVELTLTDTEHDTTVTTKAVTLTQASGYRGSVQFFDLSPGTEYRVSGACIRVTENGALFEIGNAAPQAESFRTKEAQKPTALSLSPQKLYLNLAAGSRGYGRLQATVTPKEAVAEVSYASNDENVARHDPGQGDGAICPVGVGECTITASSEYAPEVTAECAVTVRDYLFAEVDGTGAVLHLFDYRADENDVLILRKGEKRAVKIFARDAENHLTELEAFTVTGGGRIATLENGRIAAAESGSATLTATCDNVEVLLKVEVYPTIQGFGITAVQPSRSDYPAVLTEDGAYELAWKEGLDYTLLGEVFPANTAYRFDAADFIWASSDESVAAVAGNVVTPKAVGEAVVTVTPKEGSACGGLEPAKVTLKVGALPSEVRPSVTALTNVKKKMVLGDVPEYVAAPAEWGTWDGWSFEDCATPLYALPVNRDPYTFDVTYSGDGVYPYQGGIDVYMATLTGASLAETGNAHRNVLLLPNGAEPDVLPLKLSVQGYGRYEDTYGVRLRVKKGDKTGLEIKADEQEKGVWDITATKAGTYTVEPILTWTDPKGQEQDIKLKTTPYTVKVLDKPQVRDIALEVRDEEGNVIPLTQDAGGKELLVMDADVSGGNGRNLTLTAKALDAQGRELATALTWKISDKSVAKVTAGKKDSHKADMAVREDGHALLTVTAKDAAAYGKQLGVEFRSHRPRVGSDKACVNMAIDYTGLYGDDVAAQLSNGLIEAFAPYGDSIVEERLYAADGYDFETQEGRVSTELKVVKRAPETEVRRYMVYPVTKELSTGTYRCVLRLKTDFGEGGSYYSYPLTVTVLDQMPTVTVKTGAKMNLFYTGDRGTLLIKAGGKAVCPLYDKGYGKGISKVSWKDQKDSAEGFELSDWVYNPKTGQYDYAVSQTRVKVAGGKPADPDVAKGTITVNLYGYREPVAVENVKIGYLYKKPAIKTVSATSTLIPALGMDRTEFRLYDSQKKQYLCQSSSNRDNCFDEIGADTGNIALEADGARVFLSYRGDKASETCTLTVSSHNWRESVQISHTVKAAAPKPYLTAAQITCNSNCPGSATTRIGLKDLPVGYAMPLCDLDIRGKNAAAAELLSDDRLEFDCAQDGTVTVRMNRSLNTGKSIRKGTYSYQLTPYYTDKAAGERTQAAALTLKVKVTDKAPGVKVQTKGTIDLALPADVYREDERTVYNRVELTQKFTDRWTGTFADVSALNPRLIGDYSKYFRVAYDEGRGVWYIAAAGQNQLKAKQNYNLRLVYTATTDTGDRVSVVSNVIKIKPRQSTTKIKVSDNGQTLCLASDAERTFNLSLPGEYIVGNAHGALDCNKDGRADVEVSFVKGRSLKARILDRDAFVVTAKGKNYTIPVTVEIIGRDGISKDAKASVTVKIRR